MEAFLASLRAVVPSRDKYMEYEYLLERKAFRMMRKHYKDTFEKFAVPFRYKRRIKKMKIVEINSLFRKYMDLKVSCP